MINIIQLKKSIYKVMLILLNYLFHKKVIKIKN